MRNKAIWIGGIITGLYALIPSLVAFYIIFTRGSSGDPGPFVLFALPPFLPILLTYIILIWVIALPTRFGDFDLEKIAGITEITIIVNIFIWIAIGVFIGWLIKKKKEKVMQNNEEYRRVSSISLWIGIILLILGYVIKNLVSGSLWGSYIFIGSINLSIIFFAYFIFKKINERRIKR